MLEFGLEDETLMIAFGGGVRCLPGAFRDYAGRKHVFVVHVLQVASGGGSLCMRNIMANDRRAKMLWYGIVEISLRFSEGTETRSEG